jgi:hypothetical protein
VNVKCHYLGSEWGFITPSKVKNNAWTPYLELSFKPRDPSDRSKLLSQATLTVEIQRYPASTPVPADVGAADVAEVLAEGPGNQPSVLCLDSDLIFPIYLYWGVMRTDGTTRAATFSPIVTIYATTLGLGNLSITATKNYSDVIETIWELDNNTTEIDDNSADLQCVFWKLAATEKHTIPATLQVGCIVRYEGVPFHFSIKLEGLIQDRKLGQIEFKGESGPLLVKTELEDNDFTEWARRGKFEEYMLGLGHIPVEPLTTTRVPKSVK